MTTQHYFLAIDQGTTSTRAIIFNEDSQIVRQSQLEITQYYPEEGWVEHDPEEIWQSVLSVCRQALADSHLNSQQIDGIGISNQRETTIIWDRETGKPIYPAIVWQDRRTSDYCEQLIASGHSDFVQGKTGLLIDPYFSATKVRWLLDQVPGAQAQAEQGKLAFGTIDSYLLWRLTGGKRHATDITNAARTLMFNIHECEWDEELLKLFNIPYGILPEVLPNTADFGLTDKSCLGGEIPISGMAGDQQAAAIGQACFKLGMVKSTYGTGCFILLNTGQQIIKSQHRLISTVAYQIKDQLAYALEGSIFVAGAALQWLRDALNIIQHAKDCEHLVKETRNTGGVYLVPAFTGLGAPYWDPDARGAILGLTRDSGVTQIVRAALEAVCYQTRDLIEAMADDGATITSLRVDGGMVVNDWLMQFLADITNVPISRPEVNETTALGVAYLAGIQQGIYPSLSELGAQWQTEQSFTPNMSDAKRNRLYQGWLDAVSRICDTHESI